MYPLLYPFAFAAIPFFVAPWNYGGIIPALILKIILLKGRLLLGPPIALGAFAIGQGTGLLLGKLLGIQYLLELWHYGKHPHYHHKPRGWGWGPSSYRYRPKLFNRHRIRWVLRNLFHRGWKYGHPPHVFPYPPHHYIKHYDHHGHDYHDHYHHHGWGWDSHSTPHVYKGPVVSIKGSSYHSHADEPYYEGHSYSDTSYGTGKPWSSSSGGHDEHYESSDYKPGTGSFDDHHEYSESKNVEAIARKDHQLSSKDLARMAEKIMIEEFLNPKKSLGDKGGEDRHRELTRLLERQFALEIIESSFGKSKNSSSLPDFIPMPEEISELINNSTNNSTNNQTEIISTTISTPTKETTSKEPKERKNMNMFSPVWDILSKFDPVDYVPDSVMKWMFEPSSRDESSSLFSRRSGTFNTDKDNGVTEEEKVKEITSSFIKDVKNLFSLVGFLDINQCLEKMVCDVHTRRDDPSMSTYESNIVSAFKVMDVIMPMESTEEDSSTKFRLAARLGRATGSREICQRTFKSCGMDSSNIISLGNIASSALGVTDIAKS